VVVFSNTSLGKSVAPRVSIRLQAGLVSGITSMPNRDEGFVVRKNVFSGKAFVNVNIHTECKVLVVESNCFEVKKNQTSLEVENVDISIPTARVVLKKRNKNEGGISLTEADKVVSAGRGMKGPENWGMIEEMAQLLGAATACSRPVADSHWRPHHEHVGQTGVAIAPNLYIAIGISGAIQHLAGVNRSKTIVVINKDPEAPFFKAADYGIVGDAFEVVPKINQALKELA
jgi:electron transfer flavoprotein alpha subunit